MLSISDLYFIAVYTVTWCSFFRFCKEPSINSELFLNLWGGAPFVLVMSFVAENKATWILCKIHRGQSRRGCMRFMRMYGLSQGMSVLICVFYGEHSGDSNWLALLESILCTSVCIIDAENHIERIGLKDVCLCKNWKPLLPLFSNLSVPNKDSPGLYTLFLKVPYVLC